MLPNSLTVTASGETIDLTKRSEQNGESKYTGSYANSSGQRNVRMHVQHTRPANATSKISSFIKIYLDYYDTEGTFQHTVETHRVVKASPAGAGSLGWSDDLLSAILGDSTFRLEFLEGSY